MLALPCYPMHHFPKPPAKPVSAGLYYLTRVLPVKKWIARQLAKPKQGRSALVPEKFSPELDICVRQSGNSQMLTVQASPNTASTDAHILYLHGGGYALRALPMHRKFAEKWVRRTGCRVTLLEFPLPPEAQCNQTIAAVMRMAKTLFLLYPKDRFILMGDSAGGGLALALHQQLRTQSISRDKSETTLNIPKTVVLLSPWLDVSLHGIDKSAYPCRAEAMLPLMALRQSGLRYAGALSPDDPLCSPLYGPAADLGKIQIFISRDELFYPDCLRFYYRAAKAAGTQIEMVIEPRRLHCWPLIGPAFEQENNFQQMAKFCGLEVIFP